MPSKVERIAVYAGLTPVSAGGDSIGGSVLVQSPQPDFNDAGWAAHGSLGAFYRSNGQARGGHLAVTLANADIAIAYTADFARADNDRAGGDFRSFSASGRKDHAIARDEVAATAYRVRNQSLSMTLRRDIHQLQAGVQTQVMPMQLYPNQRMDLLDNRMRRCHLQYRLDAGNTRLQARLWREDVRHAMGFGPDKQY